MSTETFCAVLLAIWNHKARCTGDGMEQELSSKSEILSELSTFVQANNDTRLMLFAIVNLHTR